MISSRLTALALAALMSPLAIAATNTASGTGPTNPVESPKAPAIQSAPGLNINGSGVDSGLPPSNGTDPRVQGNDAGRQGGLNQPDTPDNAAPGIGSTTTTGGAGSEGGVRQ